MSPLVIGDFALLSPVWLWLLPLLPLAAAWLGARARGDGWHRVMSAEVHRFLVGTQARPGRGAHGVAAVLVALALAAPATRSADVATWRHGTAWIALLDVSRSMTLDDVAPSRLAAARDAVLELSRAAGARPMALVVFAGDAFLVSPPAFDRRLLETQTALLEHGSVPVDGSNVARALSLADSVANESGLASARLFLLGDLDGAGRQAEAAARHLASRGHRLDVLVFGSDDSGEMARTARVDRAAAARLADAGAGRLLVADALGRLDLDALDLDDRHIDLDGLESVLWRHQAHWVLLPLLPLLGWRLLRRGAA